MEKTQILTENKKASTKFLAVVFGYMFIGLAITSLTAFLFAYIMAWKYGDGAGGLTASGYTLLLAVGIISLIVSYVDSIVMSIVSVKSGKAPWVGFIIYAIALGFSFSLILLAGVDIYLVAEAFGITCLAFGVMFLVGYFSPIDLSPLAFVGVALLIGVLLSSTIFGLWAMISYLTSGSVNGLILYDYLISLAIIVIAMLFTGYDANRMGKIAEQGMTNNNTALYCAFTLYSDFILIFIRILYILLLSKNRNS